MEPSRQELRRGVQTWRVPLEQQDGDLEAWHVMPTMLMQVERQIRVPGSAAGVTWGVVRAVMDVVHVMLHMYLYKWSSIAISGCPSWCAVSGARARWVAWSGRQPVYLYSEKYALEREAEVTARNVIRYVIVSVQMRWYINGYDEYDVGTMASSVCLAVLSSIWSSYLNSGKCRGVKSECWSWPSIRGRLRKYGSCGKI